MVLPLPTWVEMGAFYPVLGAMELTAELGYTTVVAAYDAGAGATSGTDALARIHNEVLPDLAIYRSQLLNLFPEVGASPALADRRAGGGDQESQPLLRVVLGLSRASAQLAAYLEPREHSAASPVSHIRAAIADVQASAAALAAMFAVDMARAHQARLEALLGCGAQKFSPHSSGRYLIHLRQYRQYI